MESNNRLAIRIWDKIKSCPISESEEGIRFIENQISWQMNDAFRVIKNIDQTSLNKEDRAGRLIELEEKFGIPKTHLILK